MSTQGGGYGGQGGYGGYGSDPQGQGGYGGYGSDPQGQGGASGPSGTYPGAPQGQGAVPESPQWQGDSGSAASWQQSGGGIPPKKKSPLPWILGGCGCLLVLALAIVLVVVLVVLPGGGGDRPEEDPTTNSSAPATSDAPTSDAPTSDAPTSDAPTSDAPTTAAGAVPATPKEVAGYTNADTTTEAFWIYMTPDASDTIGVLFWDGISPEILTSSLESPQTFGTWTCGTSEGTPTCIGTAHGGAVQLIGAGKSGADLAGWGDTFVAAWV